MSSPSSRALGSFFGTVMLLAQLAVLYQFLDGVWHEIDVTAWVSRAELFARMAWLKAAPWQPSWFFAYFVVLALLTAAIIGALWISALRRWLRAWRSGDDA